MNPTVDAAGGGSAVVLFLLLILLPFRASEVLTSPASEDKYEQAMMLNNAVVGEVRVMENKDTVQEAALTDEQVLEMYPELNKTKPKEPPMSIMSGKIPDHLIKKMADYLFGLLKGTGNVVRPATTSTTTTTTTTPTTPSTTTTNSPSSPSSPSPLPDFLPFRPANKFFDDLAVIRDVPKIAEASNFGEIRRKSPRRLGVSRQKSEKLWRKTRMIQMFGRI